MEKDRHSQYVIVDLYNNGPFVERYLSTKPITLERVVAYCEKRNPEINWDKDGVTLVDDPETIDLD